MFGKTLISYGLAVPAFAAALMFGTSASAQTMLRLDYSVVFTSMQTAHEPKTTTLRRTEYIATDGKSCTQTLDPRTGAIRHVSIQDPSQDLLIELDPAAKTATEHFGFKADVQAGQPVFGSFKPVKAQKQDLGSALVDGFKCERYRDSAGPGSVEFSVCKDPQSAVTFFGNITGGGAAAMGNGSTGIDGRWHQTLTKVTRDLPIDSSLFEIPAGYQVVQK